MVQAHLRQVFINKKMSCSLFCLLMFFSFVVAQQEANPELFFKQAKNIRGMAVLRLNAIPDSSDFYKIFNEPFAKKAWQFSRFNYCYSYNGLVNDTLSKKGEDTKLPDVHYNTYTFKERFETLFSKLDSSAFFFKDSNQLIYDITLGKDPYAEYYAREWLYINRRWVCMYDLWSLLLAINEDVLKGMENFVCPVKE